MSINLFKSDIWKLLRRKGFLPTLKILNDNHYKRKKRNINIKESKMNRKDFTLLFLKPENNKSPYYNSFFRVEDILNENGLIFSVKRGKEITLKEKGINVWNKILELKDIFET